MRCLFFDAIGKVRHLAIAIDSSTKPGPAKVRATLFIAAVVASRYSPDVKALYEHLIAKGKSKMGALGQQCASWCNCALERGKTVRHIRQTLCSLVQQRLDGRDGIYARKRQRVKASITNV